MRRVLSLVVLIGVVVLFLGGCMTQFASGNGKLAYADVRGESRGRVSVEERFIYIIHPDLYIFGDKGWEEIDKDLDPELEKLGANAVRDLKLGYGMTLIDFILSAVVPLVNWGTYTIEGEAVRQ